MYLEVETFGQDLGWALELCEELRLMNERLERPLEFGSNLRVTPAPTSTRYSMPFSGPISASSTSGWNQAATGSGGTCSSVIIPTTTSSAWCGRRAITVWRSAPTTSSACRGAPA